MHAFVTVPLDKRDAKVSQDIRGFVTDLFGTGQPPWPGDFYFVRTWDRESGLDCLQVSLESDVVTADEARERVQKAAAAYDLQPTVAEIPFEEIPSPLWNSGIGGAEFDAASKQIYRAAAPVLVRIASTLGGDTGANYLLTLRLMVAHTGATVLESEQRELSSRSFDELLSLRLLSYRSHYEGAKHAQASDPATFDRRFAAYYDKLGARARDFVRTCTESSITAPDDALTHAWVEVVRQYFGTLREQSRAGLIAHDGPTLDNVNEGRDVPLQPSSFHSDLSKEMSDLLHHNPDFLAYRIYTSLLYSSLYTLGFHLAERFLFCYILARANEDVSGKATEELAEGLDAVAREFANR